MGVGGCWGGGGGGQHGKKTKHQHLTKVATCRHVEHKHYSLFMPAHRQTPPPFTRIIDTGTSHHNLALGDSNPQNYVRYTANAQQVMIPNGDNTTAYARYNLQLPNVSHKASEPTYSRASSIHQYM